MTQNRPSKSDRRESGLVQRMRHSVRQLPVESPHVLLACSGGKDSVALASLLAELRRLGLLTFAIAHIHHGQHNQADHAAEAVAEIGRALDVAVVIHHLKQKDIDAHQGVGLEEAMRRERYLALVNTATQQTAHCIALGHHETDQTETLLLHLMRGAGVAGLAGMRAWEIRRIPWWDRSSTGPEIGLWRPLIDEPATVIAEVARNSGLPIVEDPTNTDPFFRRNAIRYQLLPVLEAISPGSSAAIARSAGVIASEADLLDQLTATAYAGVREGDDLSRRLLTNLPEAMQMRVVRHWIAGRLPMLELTADRIAAIVQLADRNRGGSLVDIGAGHRVTLRHGLLIID